MKRKSDDSDFRKLAPKIQTVMRASLHGSDLARAVATAGVRFAETDTLPSDVDVWMPGWQSQLLPTTALLGFSCPHDPQHFGHTAGGANFRSRTGHLVCDLKCSGRRRYCNGLLGTCTTHRREHSPRLSIGTRSFSSYNRGPVDRQSLGTDASVVVQRQDRG